MRAIVLRKPGAPENLSIEEVADPTPAADEVVVRLRAAALNHRDGWIRSGPGAERAAGEGGVIVGSEGAGEIVAAGRDAGARLVGQSVVINPSLDWGEDDLPQGPKFRILGLPDAGTSAG